mgnify:CR=1 FL=1|jgi:hypothetical protein
MELTEWIALGGLLIVFLGAIYSAVRFLVKSIMSELLPNSGKSLRDELRVVSSRVDQIYLLLAEKD